MTRLLLIGPPGAGKTTLGAKAILALAAGDVDSVFVTIASAAPQLAGGQVKGLGLVQR